MRLAGRDPLPQDDRQHIVEGRERSTETGWHHLPQSPVDDGMTTGERGRRHIMVADEVGVMMYEPVAARAVAEHVEPLVSGAELQGSGTIGGVGRTEPSLTGAACGGIEAADGAGPYGVEHSSP